MNKEQLEKFFNTAGPIKPDLHYYIPSSTRMDWEEIWHLIGSQKYFLLHAPRQKGKTTALLEMMHALNKEARYTTLYKETGPQLLLQAFMQRILNVVGRLNREFGLGRKRTDLLIEWPLDKKLKFMPRSNALLSN